MSDDNSISRVLSFPGDDIALCTELMLAIRAAGDDELPARLTSIAASALGQVEGGFYPPGAMPPAHYQLVENIFCEGVPNGCYAFDATPDQRQRLIGLARYTAAALVQRKQEAYYRQIINQIYDSVIVMDMSGFITGWNSGAERMFGYTAEEAVGRNILFLYTGEDDESLADEFLTHGGREMEVRRRRKSGEVFWARLALSKMCDMQGKVFGIIGYLTDISERVEFRHRLSLHAKIFDQSDEAIVIADKDWKIVLANPAFEKMAGYRSVDVVGQSIEFLSAGSAQTQLAAMKNIMRQSGRWEGETLGKRKGGEEYPVHVSVSMLFAGNGEMSNTIWIISDITERKLTAERIHHLAYYDAITGLPNRSLLIKLTEQALAEARRDKSSGALMFIDLNRFKPINDTLGHAAGNALLRGVGERFRDVMRDADVVARIGDDEFVVALFDNAHNEKAAVVAQRLLASLDKPFMIEGHALTIGASVGISVYPEDGNTVEALLHNAAIALDRAKQGGVSTCVFFSHEMNQRSVEKLQLEAGLRQALINNELVLHYQPKVDLLDGSIIGAEVLVRWQHPERGLVPPAEFIPVAEESGLIVAIGNWVLEHTCAQARLWHEAGMAPIRVAANLSARQFGSGLVDGVRNLLLRHQLPPHWLELEITESMLMNSAEQVIDMMDEITGLGITLSLDDFGTGYSSLSYLKRFPIETIKIDRSFVRGIPEDSDDCAIAAAIVSMSKQLKLRVIAEGVETVAQAQFMRDLGCEEIQGYLFSAPVPAKEFERMLLNKTRLQVLPVTGSS